MPNENTPLTFVPKTGTFAKLTQYQSNIHKGDFAFTDDSNQAFIKVKNEISPILGQSKKISITTPPTATPSTVNDETVYSTVVSCTINNLSNAIITICNDSQNRLDELNKSSFDFSQNVEQLEITRTSKSPMTYPITLTLYVQYSSYIPAP